METIIGVSIPQAGEAVPRLNVHSWKTGYLLGVSIPQAGEAVPRREEKGTQKNKEERGFQSRKQEKQSRDSMSSLATTWTR